jgi:Flp pilus assembly protein CpaB
MRAISISIPAATPIDAEFVQPGRYVDVYLTPHAGGRAPARFAGGVTLTLFRGVRVLAVPDTSAGDAARAVTLELSPEQANGLILARQEGEIALGYNPDGRRDSDVDSPAVGNRDRATLDEILGEDATKAPESVAKPASSFTVESYRGGARSILQFAPRKPADES